MTNGLLTNVQPLNETVGDFVKFNVETTQSFLKEAIGEVVGGNAYNVTEVSKWTTLVMEKGLNYLMNTFKGYKFILTSTFVEKTGGGLNTTSTCFWDDSTDESCLVRWENKSMAVIIQVFAVAI